MCLSVFELSHVFSVNSFILTETGAGIRVKQVRQGCTSAGSDLVFIKMLIFLVMFSH